MGPHGAWTRALLVVFVAACDDGGDDPTGENADPPVLISADPSGRITFTDASNYQFTGTLDGPSFDLAAQSDVGIDWSALDADLQCHAVDPVADIDNVALLWFKDLSEEEVEAGMSDNSLSQVNLSLYLSYEPGDATAFTLSQLLAFGATDPEIEPFFEEGSGAWLVLFTTGTVIGQGARTLAFMNPTVGGAEMGAIPSGCDVLDWSVELEALDPIGVLADGPWNLDFGGLTTTGQGTELDLLDITEVMLARYDDLGVADLEASFLDIETLADAMWTVELSSGTAVDLATLTDADGAPFPGFDGGETWILALRCGRCPSPAPLALTLLVPQ